MAKINTFFTRGSIIYFCEKIAKIKNFPQKLSFPVKNEIFQGLRKMGKTKVFGLECKIF